MTSAAKVSDHILQTDLLALIAAIGAARAGEDGKSFAVDAEVHETVKNVTDALTAAGPNSGGPIDPPGNPSYDASMDDPWRNKVDGRFDKVDDRLGRMENEVHTLKGAMDWMKIAFAFMGAVMIGGFGILISQASGLNARMDRMEARLSEEFRAQHAEMSAQTSAIANSITATKQQAPQVILVPAPATVLPKTP